MPRGLSDRRPSGWAIALGVLLLCALGLRLWGIRSGLPYVYNADENAHFVPRAIGLFGHGWDPGYHVNPPAYTYLLHLVFAVWFGGRAGVSEAFASDPGSVFAVARVVSAVLGTAAVGLLYAAGARLFDRRVALLAAALLAVGFLPVFYGRLALNDVPALLPVALTLWAVAGVLREGRDRDFAIAGLGVGLAAATKYTAGIAALAVAAVVIARAVGPAGWRAAVRGAVLAAAAALAAFVVADPYALLDRDAFRDGLAHQNSEAGDAVGKLGLTHESGTSYYLWTLTWGLGWAALVAAVTGALRLLRTAPAIAAILIPAPLALLLFMGFQERYFGRWLLPAYPFLCLLAAYAACQLADAVGRWRPALAPVLLGALAVVLCAQGAYTSIRNGVVLARDDTRAVTRAWMVDHIPSGSKVVVEPVAPDGWAQDVGRPSAETPNGNRWVKFPTSRVQVAPRGGPAVGRVIDFEDYERTLSPALIELYERRGYCWVVTGSTQRGRAEADPEQVPEAIAYYRELERRADVAFASSPYTPGADPVAFNFDWSFDYYPSAYRRPGPQMTVYRLRGGACAPRA